MALFLVMFLAPAAVTDAWQKTDEATRQPAEAQMRDAWMAWNTKHASAIRDMKAAGKTKRVGKDGVGDTRNDMMLYAVIEAETHEAAAAMFVDHPHLGIPQSTIEVMAIRDVGEVRPAQG